MGKLMQKNAIKNEKIRSNLSQANLSRGGGGGEKAGGGGCKKTLGKSGPKSNFSA